MIRNKSFEIITVADDYMAIPVGEEATTFHGVVALSECAAFLLKQMDKPQTTGNLIDLLIDEYNVDIETAEKDVANIISTFIDLKLVLDAE